jgi:predicted small secreted protein
MFMKFMTSAVLGLTIAFAVSACNTIEGAGEDVEAAGSAIDESAEENTNY